MNDVDVEAKLRNSIPSADVYSIYNCQVKILHFSQNARLFK